MKTVEEITLEIIEQVKQVLKLSRNIDMQEDLIALGLDSMDTVILTFALEESFDIEIGDDEHSIDNISTVENMVNFISRKLEQKQEA